MFSIASQTVTLLPDPHKHDGEVAPLVLTFGGVQGHDTSKCLLTLTTPDGDVHTVTFNRAGGFLSQTFVDADDVPDDDAHPVLTGAHIVDGRDTRADNPYTHVAPATHGDPVLDAGGLQPDVFDADGHPAVTPEMREHALHEAAARARGDRDEKEGDDYDEHEHAEALGEPSHSEEAPPPEPTFTTPASPGPNPFEEAPPVRNRMTPQDPVHGRVNTTESLRNG